MVDIVFGVDPGKKGAIAFLDMTSWRLWFVDWPKDNSIKTMYDKIREIESILPWPPRHGAIEDVGAMPKNGVVSMFHFGENLGMWKGLFLILDYKYKMVRPREWHRGLRTKIQRGDNPKARSLELYRRLFPKQHKDVEGKRGGILDGRVDAALIAVYYTTSLKEVERITEE